MTKTYKKTKKGNEIIEFDFGYVSYNPCITDNIYDEILVGLEEAESRAGGDETAFCMGKEWRILNGDFRKEYAACETEEECIAVFDKHKEEHYSGFSTVDQ